MSTVCAVSEYGRYAVVVSVVYLLPACWEDRRGVDNVRGRLQDSFSDVFADSAC